MLQSGREDSAVRNETVFTIQNNGYFQQYMDWEQAQEVFCSFI